MAPLVLVIIYGSVASFVLSPFTVLHIWVVKGLNGVLRLLNDSMQWVGICLYHIPAIYICLCFRLVFFMYYCLWYYLICYLLHGNRWLLFCVESIFYRIFRLSILYERGVFSVNPGPFASKVSPQKMFGNRIAFIIIKVWIYVFWWITAGGADRLIVCWILIICTCVKVLKEKLPHYKNI